MPRAGQREPLGVAAAPDQHDRRAHRARHLGASSPIAPGPMTTTTSPASDGPCSITACTATASGSMSAPAAIESPSGSLCTSRRGIDELVRHAAVDRGADAEPVGAAVVLPLGAVLAPPAPVGVGLDRHAVADGEVRRSTSGAIARIVPATSCPSVRGIHAVPAGDRAAVRAADRHRGHVDEHLAGGELGRRHLPDCDVAGAGANFTSARTHGRYRARSRFIQTCTDTSIALGSAPARLDPDHLRRRRRALDRGGTRWQTGTSSAWTPEHRS